MKTADCRIDGLITRTEVSLSLFMRRIAVSSPLKDADRPCSRSALISIEKWYYLVAVAAIAAVVLSASSWNAAVAASTSFDSANAVSRSGDLLVKDSGAMAPCVRLPTILFDFQSAAAACE